MAYTVSKAVLYENDVIDYNKLNVVCFPLYDLSPSDNFDEPNKILVGYKSEAYMQIEDKNILMYVIEMDVETYETRFKENELPATIGVLAEYDFRRKTK